MSGEALGKFPKKIMKSLLIFVTCKNLNFFLDEDHKVENLFSLEKEWAGPDDKMASIILDLGCEETMNMIQILNSHKERATKEFTVSVSKDSDGPWEEVVRSTFEDRTKHQQSQPLKTFHFDQKQIHYVKIDVLSYYGLGAGLKFVHLKGRQN